MKNILKKLYFNKYLMLTVSFILACGIAYTVPCGEDFAVYDGTVRIHVIANSDSDIDRDIKLKVRDGVIQAADELVRGCKTKENAERILRLNLPLLEESANRVLEREGAEYRAVSIIGREYYPTRDYGTFRLPCGEYTSLRIRLGNAEGQNWWCVLYPSFCLSPSTCEIPDIAKKDSGSGYKIKFKILEVLGEVINLL